MYRKLIICCLTGVLAACGAVGTKKLNDLDRAIDSYVAALRWSRIDDASRRHLGKDYKQPEIDTSTMDQVRVTSYTIKKKVVNEDLNEASVISELDYYKTEYGTLKQMTLEQAWWYDEESKQWYIESDFPNFE